MRVEALPENRPEKLLESGSSGSILLQKSLLPTGHSAPTRSCYLLLIGRFPPTINPFVRQELGVSGGQADVSYRLQSKVYSDRSVARDTRNKFSPTAQPGICFGIGSTELRQGCCPAIRSLTPNRRNGSVLDQGLGRKRSMHSS